MLLGHVLMSSLVLCCDVPKPLDVVLLKENSCLHGIRACALGTCVHLVLKHAQHCAKCGWTTDVILHVVCAQMQVITIGLMHQPFHVLVDLQPDFVLVLRFGEGRCICSFSSLVVGCSSSLTSISIVGLSLRLAFVLLPVSACYDLSSATCKICSFLFLCYVVCVLFFLLLLLSKFPTGRLNTLSLCNFVLPLLCQQFSLSLILY